MATATDTRLAPDSADDAVATPGRGRLLARLAIVAVVLAIAIAEFVIAWLYLPSAASSQQQAQAVLEEQAALVEQELPPPAQPDVKEVDLGIYTVTAYQPASNIVLRVDFHLYGTIRTDEEKQFQAIMEARGNRIRDNVITTIRTVHLADLNDAGLGLIKRRILETTNHLLGKPFLQSVLFTEFTFVEQ